MGFGKFLKKAGKLAVKVAAATVPGGALATRVATAAKALGVNLNRQQTVRPEPKSVRVTAGKIMLKPETVRPTLGVAGALGVGAGGGAKKRRAAAPPARPQTTTGRESASAKRQRLAREWIAEGRPGGNFVTWAAGR